MVLEKVTTEDQTKDVIHYFCECDDIECIETVELDRCDLEWLTSQVGPHRLIVDGCQAKTQGTPVKVGKGYKIHCMITTKS